MMRRISSSECRGRSGVGSARASVSSSQSFRKSTFHDGELARAGGYHILVAQPGRNSEEAGDRYLGAAESGVTFAVELADPPAPEADDVTALDRLERGVRAKVCDRALEFALHFTPVIGVGRILSRRWVGDLIQVPAKG
jgi:hypothetical protein